MRDAGLDDMPVVVGGIIPPEDAHDAASRRASPRVYTPKDFELNRIMKDMVGIVEKSADKGAVCEQLTGACRADGMLKHSRPCSSYGAANRGSDIDALASEPAMR